MYLVALTGGIASGKSTILSRLFRHGAIVVSADVLAKKVLDTDEDAMNEIRHYFGEDVFDNDHSVNRKRLAEIIFSDPSARTELERITHPRIQKLFQEQLAQIESQNPQAILVYEIPLLVETFQNHQETAKPWDLIVVAQASHKTRLKRLTSKRQMSESEAHNRLSSQTTDTERARIADRVLSTQGTLRECFYRIDELWKEISLLSDIKHGSTSRENQD